MPWNLCKRISFLIAFFLISCGTSHNVPQGWKKQKFKRLTFYTPPGFSKTGDEVFESNTDSIQIVLGKDPSIPIPLSESFMDAFRAYHYNKFFDEVMMDPKVKKIFRDSVTLVDINPITVSDSTSCKNCNVIAKIKFKKKVFDFPVQMNQSMVDKHQCYTLYTESNDRYEKSIYKGSGDCSNSVIWIRNDKVSYSIILPPDFKETLALGRTVHL